MIVTHANGFSYINTCQLRHLRDPAYQRRAAGPSRLALKIIDHATVETYVKNKADMAGQRGPSG